MTNATSWLLSVLIRGSRRPPHYAGHRAMGKVCAYLFCRRTKLVIQVPHPSYPSATPAELSPGPPRAPLNPVGHTAGYTELRDPFGPLPSSLVQFPPLCSTSKLPPSTAWQAPSGSGEVSSALAQRRGASAAPTRPLPAAAASQAAPRTTAELVSVYRRQGGIQAAESPPCPIQQRDLQLPQVSWLSIGARAPGLPLEKDPAAPPCSGTKHTRPWGLSPFAGTGNLVPPAPSSFRSRECRLKISLPSRPKRLRLQPHLFRIPRGLS